MRPRHIDAVTKMVPLGWFGTTEEVAALVTFLASDKASYISTPKLAVDGGTAT